MTRPPMSTPRPARFRGLSLALIVSAAVATLTGCTPATDFTVPLEGPGLALGTPTALDVRNNSGNVTVKVDRRLEAPEVRATLRSVNPAVAPRPATRDDGVLVVARGEEQAGRYILRVESDAPAENAGLLQVDLEIRTPSCDGLRIRNAGGYVRVWGVAGAIEIENTDDASGTMPARFVEVRTDQPVPGPVSIRTTDDSIYYVVSGNSSGVFDIRVPPGKTYSVDHRLGSMTGAVPTPTTWRAVFNGGTQPIRLIADDGAVKVRVYEDPMSFKPWGTVRP